MAAKHIPATIRKLVATRASQKFRKVVTVIEVPTPQPREGEVLVKNRFVGINASDINFTAARYDPAATFPLDIGFEAIGEVVSTGENCPYGPGQAVMYMKYGAFSDYKVLKASSCIPLPKPDPRFLPFIVSGNTAAIALDQVGDMKAGETVLVTAAAGGTGQMAVQWAKLKGCHVIGTCSTDDKITFLKTIGCDRPVNYKKESLRAVLKKEYPEGVDIVYESVGGEMFDICVDSLAKKGRMIVIGFISGYENDRGFTVSRSLATLPPRLLMKSASVRGFFLSHFSEHVAPYAMQLIQYYKDGKLNSVIDMGETADSGPFVGLDKIVDAVDHLYSQKSIGKIVVELNSKL